MTLTVLALADFTEIPVINLLFGLAPELISVLFVNAILRTMRGKEPQVIEPDIVHFCPSPLLMTGLKG